MLFHILDNKNIKCIKEAETEQLIVLLRKCSLKFQRANSHLWFLSKCKSSKVFPKFIKIYTKSKSISAVKAIEAAKKKWMEEERKTWFVRREAIGEMKLLISTELMSKLNSIGYMYEEEKIVDLVREEAHRHYLRLTRKFERLVGNQRQADSNKKPKSLKWSNPPSLNVTGPIEKTKVNSFPVYDVKCDFYPRFKNLSHLYVTAEEEKILNLGLKHGFSSEIGKKDIFDLAADCEVALSTRHVSFKDQKKKCGAILRRIKDKKIRRSEFKTLKNLRSKIEDQNLIICKADKGNTVTIMNRSVYIEKINEYVRDNNLTITREKNILNKYIAQVKRCIKECPQLLANIYTHKNPQIPKLYGLPKIHKDGNPVRPVVSCTNAPNVVICKRLVAVLPELIKFQPKRSLKNNREFVEKIKNIVIPENAKLISFDVKNLFPSVPVQEVKDMIVNRLSHLSEPLQVEVKKTLDICLNQNFCSFTDQIFEIKSGLPIGSPISPLMADIFMDHIEENIFSSVDPLIASILHWYRYVDDIFAVVNGTWRQIDILLEKINLIHPNITFTLEKEQDGKLNFLDLGVRKVAGRLNFSIYRKGTFTDCIISKSSNHPVNIKYAAFHSMLNRLISIPMDTDHYLKELGTIHLIAKNNGYKKSEINSILAKKLRNQKRGIIYANVPKAFDDSWRKIRYLDEDCLKIGTELKKVGVQPAYYNNKTVGKFLVNNKPKTGIEVKSGIYSKFIQLPPVGEYYHHIKSQGRTKICLKMKKEIFNVF
uniref:Reverse transcriptase domain-containing protein n=1 Tax=Cacopsylla melanoneura TaxID=428564 RepID=A0A8D9DWV2_9HEMI